MNGQDKKLELTPTLQHAGGLSSTCTNTDTHKPPWGLLEAFYLYGPVSREGSWDLPATVEETELLVHKVKLRE